jgi:hypothetical protein
MITAEVILVINNVFTIMDVNSKFNLNLSRA